MCEKHLGVSLIGPIFSFVYLFLYLNLGGETLGWFLLFDLQEARVCKWWQLHEEQQFEVILKAVIFPLEVLVVWNSPSSCLEKMKFGHHMLSKGRAFWLLLNQFKQVWKLLTEHWPKSCWLVGSVWRTRSCWNLFKYQKINVQRVTCEFFLFPTMITQFYDVSLGWRWQKLKTPSQKYPSGCALGLPSISRMAGGITDTGELYSPYVSSTACGFGHKFFQNPLPLSVVFANPTSSWTQPQHFRRWWRSKGG